MIIVGVALLVLATNQIAAGQNTFMCIGNGTLPSHCFEAVNNFSHMFQQIYSNPKLLSNQTADFLQKELNVICGGECLGSLLKCLPNSTHNTILNVTCAQSEGGDFCPAELLREQARVGKLNIFPNCVANSTCSAFCQQSLRDLRSRLGCCTDSMYAGMPVTAKYFATCNVSLDTPCKPATVTSGTTEMTEITNMTKTTETTENSGADFLSLNLLLVATLFLVAIVAV